MNDTDINSWASDVDSPPPSLLQLDLSPQAGVKGLPVSFLQSIHPSISSSTLNLDEDTTSIPESPPSSPTPSKSFVKSGAPLVSIDHFTVDTENNYAVR